MVARDPCFEDERERYRNLCTLYTSCNLIPMVEMDDLGPMTCLDFEREMTKQQLVISQAMTQQKLGLMYPGFLPIDTNICQATGFNPINTGIQQAPQCMSEIKLEPLPEPEPVYKEKAHVKWYELLILAALAWVPFMLGLAIKLLTS